MVTYLRNGSIRTGGDVLAARPKSETLSTGLPGLDRVFTGLLPGDNIVWQVDVVEDYRPFVDPFVRDAIARGKRLVYFRFARHPELVPRGIGAEIHTLHPEVGFETFTARIHKVIEEAGRGAFYVFDCLSDLAADWYSDLMLGNFFMVTCPYLYDLETVTYFALLRDGHSFDAVSSIRDTTQLLIDVFRHKERLYVHPLKVDRRSLPDDVPPPRPGREGVPPRHGERGALRGAGGPLEAARGRRLAHARHLGPEVPPGAGGDRRGPARRAPRGGGAGDLRRGFSG